jgi:hypothetical protein
LNNKVKTIVSLFFIACFAFQLPDSPKSTVIAKGEKITYDVNYGILNAGEIMVTIDTAITTIDSSKCYKAQIVAKTKGIAGLFSTINDVWISYIDSASLQSKKFTRNQQENDYRSLENTEFDRANNQALVTRMTEKNDFQLKSFNTTANVHDLVSAYFNLRTRQGEKMVINEILQYDIFLEDTTFHLQIKYLGKERLKTKLGRQKSYLFSPIVPKTNNSMLVGDNAITTWISADDRRIPLKIEIKTKYGNVQINIVDYQGGSGK